MLERWSGLCLGFIMAGLLGACEQPAEQVPEPLLDEALLQLPFVFGSDIQEMSEAWQAEMARVIEDWRTHAVQEGWSLMQPAGRNDREMALACQPAFEAHFARRPHRPGAIELHPDSLRVGLLNNGIRLGTIIVSLKEQDTFALKETALFRFDTCDVISARPVSDRVSLSVVAGQETARARLLAEWLAPPTQTEIRINPERNAAAVFIPQDLVSADLDLVTEDQCRIEDIVSAADRALTLDEICPGEAIRITPVQVETLLWLAMFGEDDMAAHLASEDRPDTILVDASKRPGLRSRYLLDVYATVSPSPAADVWPRPEEVRLLYPIGTLPPEKN